MESVWIWMTLFFILLFINLVLIAIKIFSGCAKVRLKIGIYADPTTTIGTGDFTLNLSNVRSCPEIWNVHEKDLILYAMGKPTKFKFIKHESIPNGYKISLKNEEINSETMLQIVAAIKYDRYKITPDKGRSFVRAYPLRKKEISKVDFRVKEKTSKISNKKIEKEFFEQVKNSEKTYYLGEGEYLKLMGGAMGHVNELKTTSDSIRIQMYVPPTSVEKRKVVLNDAENNISYYHQFSGKLYKLETNFLGIHGNIIEWEAVNLEPGKIYAGLSVSNDGGKTIAPSMALYGITKLKNGIFPTLDEVAMAKPSNKMKSFPMWTESISKKYLGPEITAINYKIIAKKQYEFDNKNEFISLKNADQIFEKYPWLKKGEKYFDPNYDEKKIQKNVPSR